MKRRLLVLFLGCIAASFAWSAPEAVGDLQKEAQKATAERRYDDAFHLHERIITEHPEASSKWFWEQRNEVNLLIKKGDLAEAVKAVHLCLDTAPDIQTYNDAVLLTAKILSALDQNVERANQFLAFHQGGAESKAVNPMDSVGYPSMPKRESAFAVMRQHAGDSADSSLLRARTFLFSAKPKEALEQYADAFRRGPSPDVLQRTAPELIVIGLRAVRGTTKGLDAAVQFVLLGPCGPDGKPNTEDDLADPFAPWLPQQAKPGEGGTAGIGADDLATMRRLRDDAQLYAADPWVFGDLRLHSLAAVQRLDTALDAWGRPGLKDWYLRLVLVNDGAEGDFGLRLNWGVQAAARGTALHLENVTAVQQQIDEWYTSRGLNKPKSAMVTARDQFNAVIAALKRLQFAPPRETVMTKPATL